MGLAHLWGGGGGLEAGQPPAQGEPLDSSCLQGSPVLTVGAPPGPELPRPCLMASLPPPPSCCGAGTAADTEMTTQLISSNMELHSLSTGRLPRVVTANRMLKQMLFRCLLWWVGGGRGALGPIPLGSCGVPLQAGQPAQLLRGTLRTQAASESKAVAFGIKYATPPPCTCVPRYQGYIGAALVLGGVDVTGPHLYSIYPHGSTDKLPYVTMGE